jgi:hypothetical protein
LQEGGKLLHGYLGQPIVALALTGIIRPVEQVEGLIVIHQQALKQQRPQPPIQAQPLRAAKQSAIFSFGFWLSGAAICKRPCTAAEGRRGDPA